MDGQRSLLPLCLGMWASSPVCLADLGEVPRLLVSCLPSSSFAAPWPVLPSLLT